MGNSQVFAFEKAKAGALSAAVLNLPGVVYEAHSTDYQTESALAELVAAHFPILKVGPALTFAYREAVVAMAAIEDRMNFPVPSRIVEVLREAMDANDVYWRAYIAADDQRELMKIYGLSDRVRYYWPDPKVEAALATLTANVNSVNVPLGLISQFIGAMPPPDPVETFARRAVRAKAGAVVATYRRACRG
jgi:D-tagatose-1,6-bisphosphate aldolase subunit GatZ/KbaZ